jgi:hypothetical protein
VSEYRITALLRVPSHVSDETFRQRLDAVAHRLRRFVPELAGTRERYKVSVRTPAASSREAEDKWWREVEPVLESENLGSNIAVYSQLPRVTATYLVPSAFDTPLPVPVPLISRSRPSGR